MDLVLLIISIVFACSKEEHSYTAIMVLAIIGLIFCVIAGFFAWYFFISAVIYLIVLLICGGASNKR